MVAWSDACRCYPVKAEHPPIEAKPETLTQIRHNTNDIIPKPARFSPSHGLALMVVSGFSQPGLQTLRPVVERIGNRMPLVKLVELAGVLPPDAGIHGAK